MVATVAISSSRDNHSQTTVTKRARGKEVGELRFHFCENVAMQTLQGDSGQWSV